MQLIAITRQVSASINDCALSFHTRQPIDVVKAIAQHKGYEDCLAGLGVQLVTLPAEPRLPDAAFVEDAAVVVDEVAVIPIMGAAKIVWFHGSSDGVRTAATMKMMRIAYWKFRHRKRAVTRRIFARKKTTVGI